MDNQKDFGFTILGSGSGGNATVIHGPAGSLLLDAGFSARELCRRMEGSGIDPASIRGILLTHEHSDHLKGCRVFGGKFSIPVYLTEKTLYHLDPATQLPPSTVVITPGSAFSLCGVRLEPFTVPHDVDAVAYVFECAGRRLGYATDLGTLNLLAMNKLTGCDALVLESNHDLAMLRNSGRPLHLKRRIMGRQGHLSNDAAMEALGVLLTDRTMRLVLAHVSGECNNMEVLRTLLKKTLEILNRRDILSDIASQSEPLETIWV